MSRSYNNLLTDSYPIVSSDCNAQPTTHKNITFSLKMYRIYSAPYKFEILQFLGWKSVAVRRMCRRDENVHLCNSCCRFVLKLLIHDNEASGVCNASWLRKNTGWMSFAWPVTIDYTWIWAHISFISYFIFLHAYQIICLYKSEEKITLNEIINRTKSCI